MSLFPKLIAIDNVLPEDIGSRGHGREGMKIGQRHPDGQNGVLLTNGLTTTYALTVVPCHHLAKEELHGAGDERDNGEEQNDLHIVGIVHNAFGCFAHDQSQGAGPDVEGDASVFAQKSVDFGQRKAENLGDDEWQDEEGEYLAENEEEGMEKFESLLWIDNGEDEWDVDGCDNVNEEGVGYECLGAAPQFGGDDGSGCCGWADETDHGTLGQDGRYGCQQEIGEGAGHNLKGYEHEVPLTETKLLGVYTTEGEQQLCKDEAWSKESLESPSGGLERFHEIEAVKSCVYEHARDHGHGQRPVL